MSKSRSGNYEKYIASDWHVSDDGLWEQNLQSMFDRCKEALNKDKHSNPQAKKVTSHKIRVPQGARTSTCKRQVPTTISSALLQFKAPSIEFDLPSTPIQAQTSTTQNCVVAAVANALLEVYNDASKDELQQLVWSTEEERSVSLSTCNSVVRRLSKDRVSVSKPKKFVKDTKVHDWNEFFLSKRDDSFGVFLVEVQTYDGSKQHVICLVKRKHGSGPSYLVDGNPKFGGCTWPLATASFAALEISAITYAIKMAVR